MKAFFMINLSYSDGLSMDKAEKLVVLFLVVEMFPVLYRQRVGIALLADY